MPTSLDKKFWSRLFLAAALFNYVIGFPILLASRWSYDLTYMSDVTRDTMALRLWADFGFAVLLIGFGYQIIAHDVTQNRGIVLLGIAAKLFDVVNLSTLYAWDIARPLVLVPAAIDGAFAIAFVWFWLVSGPPMKLRGHDPGPAVRADKGSPLG
ncbi:hypothetical protein [Streptomyces netropsis]|uniref:Uncharacterized protein n=2 Tax=Streptomyces netropsis TaxID=55404 RepID=A0A7W7PGX2_STRNE|nr:hypothetical protein [Streptomyces netropsis]MBB4889292.1 hypothetical protein [Streptomyces netropsis]GGR47310.1 hypothetical protein GCM10010219_61100 [Streptomyces netropsis]